MNRLIILALPFLLTLAACEDNVEVEETPATVGTTDGAMTDGTTLGTTPGIADFDTWDTDRDTYLSEDEFRTGYTGTNRFHDLDTDRSGMLSEQEWMASGQFQGQTFSDWDTDGTGELTEEQFLRSTFRQYDRDGDGRLSQDEFRELMNALGATDAGTMGTTPGMGTAPGTDATGTGAPGGTSY